MIIIGEKLNSSVPATLRALELGDTAAISEIVVRQTAAGAHYLDINTALCGERELERMLFVLDIALSRSSCGIMLDSPDPNVIKAAADRLGSRPAILNSVTLTERLGELVPLAAERGYGVVGLPVEGGHIPRDAASRTENALRLIDALVRAGIPEHNIYLDVLVQSLAADVKSAAQAIETIRRLRSVCPRVNTLCGLSNISFGLPGRAVLNNAFLCAAISAGLTSAILDITCDSTRKAIYAAKAVAGLDEYCLEYIEAMREKQK